MEAWVPSLPAKFIRDNHEARDAYTPEAGDRIHRGGLHVHGDDALLASMSTAMTPSFTRARALARDSR